MKFVQFLTQIVLVALGCIPLLSFDAVRQSAFAQPAGDYYDGLRAWDLGQKELALSIWFEAAEWGDPKAIEKIAEAYAEGTTIPTDLPLSYFWYLICKRNDESVCGDQVSRLALRVKDEERRAIEEASKRWAPRRLSSPTKTINVTASIGKVLRAIDERDPVTLLRLLHDGASPNLRTQESIPIIFLAIATEDAALVDAILAEGGLPTVALEYGLTPLHLAAASGSSAIVDLLLKYGATPSVQDRNGIWPDEIAVKKKFSKIAFTLRNARMAELRPIIGFLGRFGYFQEASFDDPVYRRHLIQSLNHWLLDRDNDSFSSIDQTLLDRLKHISGDYQSLPFSFFAQYDKEGKGYWAIERDVDFAASYADAMVSARKWCERELGGTNCQVSVWPPGMCMAVAHGDQAMGVSRVSPSNAYASEEAMRMCTIRTDGCSIRRSLCS